jgi:hypothetical protein
VTLAYAVQDAPALLLEEIVVAFEPMEEIDVETVVEGIGGIRPFGYHEALRIFFFE